MIFYTMYKLLNINDICIYEHYLNDYDKMKITKFVKKEDCLRAIGSIILQKEYIQSKKDNIYDLRQIVIQYTIYGKPYYDNLLYNVSHDCDYVIIVYSDRYDIGVDIMKHRSINMYTFYDYFSLHERSLITNDTFIEFWCAKEAFVKAIGLGLNVDLKTVEYIDGNIHYNNKLYNVKFIDIVGYICAYVQIIKN